MEDRLSSIGARSAKKNPYDWVNPVAQAKLFAGRTDELSAIAEEIARLGDSEPIAPTITIVGERRVGKTSLLRRIEEMCHEYHLVPIMTSVTDASASNAWYFWQEIFSNLLFHAEKAGILLSPEAKRQLGFPTPAKQDTDHTSQVAIPGLLFPEMYMMHIQARGEPGLTNHILAHDLNAIAHSFFSIGYQGIILLLDEAQILVDAQDIKQQIRYLTQGGNRYGIVFAGESRLSMMFTEPSEPFFGQARVVSLKSFMNVSDVAQCALLPLSEDERCLISPVTVDYLSRLSQGKPNQIRLICHSIYNRYVRGEQDDLNITVAVLDDVLDVVAEAFEEAELITRIDAIRRLSSVDLELLYNMTRYPNWSARDVVDLDESFRGQSKSDLATARRQRNLARRQEHFVSLGLMVADKDRYVLAGGEFVSLYLRFWHEVSRYGTLSRALVLGKGPQTPFGEKSEKLVKSLAYVLGESPRLRRFVFHSYYRDEGDIIESIRRRFSTLEKLVGGERPDDEDSLRLLAECLSVCEMVGEAGVFYLLCLSIRNLESPREVMQVELYFDAAQMRAIDLLSLFNLMNQQASDARVLIEGYDGFLVKLTDLAGLLEAVGVPSLDWLLAKMNVVERWRLASVQHLLQSREAPAEVEPNGAGDEGAEESARWIELYSRGAEKEAEDYLIRQLGETKERHVQARLHNDLGYIRSGPKLRNIPLARKNLETALDLHYLHLPLTLLNLSYIDLDEGEYEPAVKRIEEALLLTFSRLEIEASYLRLRLPENHLGFRERWEQHPANVLEASYINMAYALLKSQGYPEAVNVLQEGLSLLPSSNRLKHALARQYLFMKRADLARPVYEEISQTSLPDKGIELEVKVLSRGLRLTKEKRRGKRHKA